MIVEQEKVFTPITIRLLTEKEITLMWHLLAASIGGSLVAYMNKEGMGYTPEDLREFKNDVWHKLDRIIKLGGEKE